MIGKSVAIEGLVYQYTHLPMGGKKVRCPYWVDKIKKKIWGPFGGKGSPEQIVEATLMAAKKEGINLNGLSAAQIRSFLKRNRIGIDCSGLVFNLLDALDKEGGGNGLADDIPGAKGKFLIRASVKMLTNNKVSVPVKVIKEIKMGDMIRLGGRTHIVVITAIKKEKTGKIKEIIYAHSSPRTKVSGVHKARIKIKEEAAGLEKQDWLEKTRRGENYGQKYFRPEKGDGIRRLKIWLNWPNF